MRSEKLLSCTGINESLPEHHQALLFTHRFDLRCAGQSLLLFQCTPGGNALCSSVDGADGRAERQRKSHGLSGKGADQLGYFAGASGVSGEEPRQAFVHLYGCSCAGTCLASTCQPAILPSSNSLAALFIRLQLPAQGSCAATHRLTFPL